MARNKNRKDNTSKATVPAVEEITTTETGIGELTPEMVRAIVAREAKRRAYQKAYRERNKDKVAASHKKYRDSHPEEVKGWQKKWRDANPDKVKAYHTNYRTKTVAAMKAEEAEMKAATAEGRELELIEA